MADTILNEPLEANATSLQGLYTDFDEWIIKYQRFYKRSENKQQYQDVIEQQEITNPLRLADIFMADILLQRPNLKQPRFSLKENDEFMFYDYVLFRLLDKNGERSIISRFVRSKL